MQQLRVNTDPAYWCGVIPEPPVVGRSSGDLIRASGPVNESYDWFDFCNPSLNQVGDSCVGWGWAHWLTGMIRRYADGRAFAAELQINGQAIWEKGRDMFWGGTRNGGLYLPQGFEAIRAMGMIPENSVLLRVASDWDSVGLALLDTPIVQAHAIHKGWFEPNPENGCIDHAPMASGSNGYHCTLRVARIRQLNKRFYVTQNSWGAEWGFGGYGVMTAEEDAEGLMSPGLYTALLPVGWAGRRGWEKYLIAV